MIITQSVNLTSCIACFVYQSKGETTKYFNDNVGHYHKWLYITEGALDTYMSDTATLPTDSTLIPLISGKVYDLEPSKGKYVFASAKNTGASMLMLNPTPIDLPITVEILTGKQTKELTARERLTILCVTGPMEANGKPINSMQYATLNNKAATITLYDTSVVALITG